MQLLAAILLLTAAYPLGIAWLKNRRTTLVYPLLWGWSAWLVWSGVVGGEAIWSFSGAPLGRYLALCLTGCTGVAGVGARKPGAAAGGLGGVGPVGGLFFLVGGR